MDWTQMTVYTTSQGCEYISSMLFSIGVTGIEIFDPEDYKHIEKNYTWDYIDDEVLALAEKEAYIRIYFPHTPYGIEQIELVKNAQSRPSDPVAENRWCQCLDKRGKV